MQWRKSWGIYRRKGVSPFFRATNIGGLTSYMRIILTKNKLYKVVDTYIVYGYIMYIPTQREKLMSLLLEQAKEFVIATLPNVKFADYLQNKNRFSYHDDNCNLVHYGSIRVDRNYGNLRYTVNIKLHYAHANGYKTSNERTVRKFADNVNDTLNYTKKQSERLLAIAKTIKRDDADQLMLREHEKELANNKEKFIEELRANGFDMTYSTDYHKDLNASMMTEVLTGSLARITINSKDIEFVTKLREFVRAELGEKV